MPITHTKVTILSDNPAYDCSKDEWNANHTVTKGQATVLVGTTYIDKVHGMATTPDISDIHLTPQDDLGGRNYWVSDVGPTTFRINISSMDFADHIFGYIIV